jgi:predicted transposase YbfD/YdcC
LLVHPAIAESYATALEASASSGPPDSGLPRSALEDVDLLQRFAAVSDGRSDQGRDHPVAVVLVLCAAAVLAGMRSFTAIAGWVADVPAALLAVLYQRAADGADDQPERVGHAGIGAGARSVSAFPSKTTLWRVLTGADTAAVNAAIGAWLLEQARTSLGSDGLGSEPSAGEQSLVGVAVDGKAVRGAVDTDGGQTHLLAAATHADQLVLGQVQVGVKSNEIPQFAPLITGLAAAGVDLSNVVITADALHCQRGHAEHLHDLGAHFCLPVKHNQPGLYAALDALPWTQVPVSHRATDRGHGRVTTRTIQVLPAPADLPFPHVNQVWLIERYTHDTAGTPLSAVAQLGLTSLTPAQAGPAEIAGLVRNHWGIEALHWLRDTVYREDHSRSRTGSGGHIMAALRNLAIGVLHLAGRRDITEATRWVTRYMHRAFDLLHINHT